MGFQHVGFVALLWTATLRTSRLLHQSHGSSSTGLIDASLKLLSIVRLSVINRVQGYWKTVTEPCSLATKGEKMDSLHSNIRDWKATGGGLFYCRTKLDIELEGDRGDCNEAGGVNRCWHLKNVSAVGVTQLVPAFGSANFLFAE
ncbi:hypothetical protein RHGRI_015883 [Rhododendron griersonianum]|uniref:Secreted protein n=1 Tax=Rhododendron griersonianum TaxID=479676 RepID=A0AAV6JSL6_9ERIC|nr:hypothetical protein RHGRI_015883 [Rhododendron griersonianum]